MKEQAHKYIFKIYFKKTQPNPKWKRLITAFVLEDSKKHGHTNNVVKAEPP